MTSSDRKTAAYRLAVRNGGELIRFYEDPAVVKWRLPVPQNDPLIERVVSHATVLTLIRNGSAAIIESDPRGRPTRIKIAERGVRI